MREKEKEIKKKFPPYCENCMPQLKNLMDKFNEFSLSRLTPNSTHINPFYIFTKYKFLSKIYNNVLQFIYNNRIQRLRGFL